MYKEDFRIEPYLLLNIPRRLRRYIAKFRTSSTNLEIEKGRHNGVVRENRFCKLCVKDNVYKVEDEYHMLLECKTYEELRTIYLEQTETNLFTFRSNMQTVDSILLTHLANFICLAFEIRAQKLC